MAIISFTYRYLNIVYEITKSSLNCANGANHSIVTNVTVTEQYQIPLLRTPHSALQSTATAAHDIY